MTSIEAQDLARQEQGHLDGEPRSQMRIVAVHAARPRKVAWKGRSISTGIYKEPVIGRVPVNTLNLAGDRQADLSVHGGWNKAIYAYPAESYALWRRERPELAVTWGMFGENLTLEGLLEEHVHVGDRFRIGSVELQVTEPRLPCFKLGIRMGRDEFVAEFLARGLFGFYCAVLKEGELAAGDAIIELSRDPRHFKVTEIARLHMHGQKDTAGLRRAAGLTVLSENWRDYFRTQLERLERHVVSPSVPDVGAPAWSGFRPFVLRERVQEARDIASFYLQPADGALLPPYLPGQFITLRLPDLESPPTIRSYSLSGGPGHGAFRITVKRLEGGRASTFLHDHLRVGGAIEVKAPAGRFTLDPGQHYRPVVLVGAGIGITPLLSMLTSILESDGERETWIFYGVRDQAEEISGEQLRANVARQRKVHLHLCYSRSAPPEDSPSGVVTHTRRIDLDLLTEVLPASYYDYYLCGPAGMMQTLYEGLQEWGVPPYRIHTEAFGPAAVIPRLSERPAPPASGIEVTFARSSKRAVWRRAGMPLLELAEETGVSIPFGCRAGSCGTCITRVVSGDVAYLQTPDAPLDHGEALLCVGVPATALVLDA